MLSPWSRLSKRVMVKIVGDFGNVAADPCSRRAPLHGDVGTIGTHMRSGTLSLLQVLALLPG